MPATIVESAVDWLSMSVNRPADAQRLLDWRDGKFKELEDAGYAEKRYSAHGYSYRSRGAVSVGVGPGSVLLQCSGSEAGASWRHCAQWATNVSRVDLAVTARPDVATDALARSEYEAARGGQRGRGRRPKYTVIVAEDRGDTLYVGSRTSDQLGRLYDKGRESREEAYKGCWRWEVQYRRDVALSTVRALLPALREAETIAATVASWFRARGVSAAYHVGGDPLANKGTRAVPDDQRFLEWLRKSVQPRCRELVKRYGWRYVAETAVGRIATYDEWESLLRGIEVEFEAEES